MESPQGDEHDFKEAGILSTGACRPSETEGGLAAATACPSAGAAGAAGEGNVGNSGSWGGVTADDAVSRSTALMERPDASSARPAGVTSSSDGDEDKRTYATRAGSEGRATEGFCRGTSAPESTATATETAEDAPATATDEPAPADEAAATGDVSLWSFWPSDWQVLPLNRLATLIIETLVSGGTSLQRDSSKHSSRTSSSRGRSSYNSRDSSLEHWRDRRSRNSRLRRKEHRGELRVYLLPLHCCYLRCNCSVGAPVAVPVVGTPGETAVADTFAGVLFAGGVAAAAFSVCSTVASAAHAVAGALLTAAAAFLSYGVYTLMFWMALQMLVRCRRQRGLWSRLAAAAAAVAAPAVTAGETRVS